MRYLKYAILVLIAAQLYANERTSVALTVYNNDLALVKEHRNLNLSKGINEIRITDVPAQIDPTSVHFNSTTAPDKVAILEQNYEYDLADPYRILHKYIDHEITVFTSQDGPFQGILMNYNNDFVTLKMHDKRIKVIAMKSVIDLDFPHLPDGLISKPTLVWQVKNSKSGKHDTEISYLTHGITWHAEYVAVSHKNDTHLEMNSWVSIDNKSGTGYTDARLKLVAGDVNIIRRQNPPRPMSDTRMMIASAERKQFEEKSFFEYHMYTLQRPTTIRNNQIKQIMLFPAVDVKVDKKYTYNGARDEKNVRTNLEFKNSTAAGVGIPLPKGKVRVYKADPDDAGTLEFVGEDLIPHTPVDETVRVFLGNAFDIKGERTQKEIKKVSKRSREESWLITLRNHKKKTVTVTVIESIWGDWEMQKYSHEYHKKDANTIEFTIPVASNSEAQVEYTAFIKW